MVWRVLLHALVVTSLGVFVVTTLLRPSPAFSALRQQPAPLWSQAHVFPATLQWVTLMVAAMATAALSHLSRSLTRQSASAQQLYASTTATSTFTRKVRMLWSYQVRPVRFWSWLCGGLNVFEVVLVVMWWSVTFFYLGYYMLGRLARYQPIDPALRALQWQDNLASVTGKVLFVLVMLMFLPISRSNFLQWLFGTDYTTVIKYHKWLSKGTLLFVFIHSLLFLHLWVSEGTLFEQINWDTTLRKKARQNLFGTFAAAASLIIYFFSTDYFQQNHFWLFYYTHIWGFLAFTVFGMLHYKGFVNWIFPGLILYGIDRGFRYWQMVVNWTTIRPSDVVIDNGMVTVQLRWKQIEGKAISAGQHFWLRCPAISVLQAHPFSMADVQKGEGDTVLVTTHFRCFGAWSQTFAHTMAQGCSLSAQVEGPYLATLDHITSSTTAPVIVMVAGGIGVTPLLGILRHYVRQFTDALSGNAPTTGHHTNIYLIWTSRHVSDLKLFGTELLEATTLHHADASSSVSSSSSPHTYSAHKLQNLGKLASDPASGMSPPAGASAAHLIDWLHTGSKSTGWLHAALHYTGFELENDDAGTNSSTRSCLNMAKDGHIGQDNGNGTTTPRPLDAHPMMRPWLYALCTLAGFIGAGLGALLGAWYETCTATTMKRSADPQIAATFYSVGIALGSILLPCCVLALHQAWLMKQRPSMGEHDSANSSDFADPELTKILSSSSADGIYSTSLRVLPGYVLAPLSEAGSGVALGRGRPNIDAVLRAVAGRHSSLKEIPVLIAASDAMALPVEHMCAEQNRACTEGRPVFMTSRVSHHH